MHERIRPPPVNQPPIAASRLAMPWLPTIGTPPSTSPGMPPLCSVFIICTQLPSASTMLSSQLPVGCLGFAPAASSAAGGETSSTCSVRSTFGLLRRIRSASCAW